MMEQDKFPNGSFETLDKPQPILGLYTFLHVTEVSMLPLLHESDTLTVNCQNEHPNDQGADRGVQGGLLCL